MALIEKVSEEELDLLRKGGGAVSRFATSIIEEFQASGLEAAKITTERDPLKAAVTLRGFIKTHELPYKVSVRRGDLFILKQLEVKEKELTGDEVDEH